MNALKDQFAKYGVTEIASDLSMILVMGITGSGKSYFINKLAGRQVVPEGAELSSCTQECQLAPVNIGQTKTLIIDTPGFDDTIRTDADILRELTTILTLQHESGIALKGIIYIHRISDIRYGGSAIKTLQIFRRLCGDGALGNVMLVTSRWQEVDQRIGAEREKQLREKFWTHMLRSGSNMSRFHGDRDSAIGLVSQLLNKDSVVLDIQREIRSGQSLDKTSAGSYVNDDIERLKVQHRDDLESLRRQLQDGNAEMLQEIQAELEQEQAKLKFQEQRKADLNTDIWGDALRKTKKVMKRTAAVGLPLLGLTLDILGLFVTIPCDISDILNV